VAKGTTVLYNNEGQKIAQQKSHLKRGWGGGGGQEFENFGIFFSLPEKKFKFGLSGWFFGNSKIPYTFPNHTGPSDAKIQPQ
jgi:hypothetical protein